MTLDLALLVGESDAVILFFQIKKQFHEFLCIAITDKQQYSRKLKKKIKKFDFQKKNWKKSNK